MMLRATSLRSRADSSTCPTCVKEIDRIRTEYATPFRQGGEF